MFDTPFMITAEMMARDDKTNAEATRDRAGNADSRTLAKDWRAGKGNTKDENFVTPKDADNTQTFDEVMEQKQGEPGFTGEYRK